MIVDQFDKDGNYRIFKGVALPEKKPGAKCALKKMKVGDSVKAYTASEANRLYALMYQLTFKARQYKTGKGYWWIQRVQ